MTEATFAWSNLDKFPAISENNVSFRNDRALDQQLNDQMHNQRDRITVKSSLLIGQTHSSCIESLILVGHSLSEENLLNYW